MLRVVGKPEEIASLKAAIEAKEPDLRIEDQGEVRQLQSFGMEPMVYLVICFCGHLAADLAHDQIRTAIKRWTTASPSITIEEAQADEEL
jgi:hypothetical protein